MLSFESAGLWGTESDSDDAYLAEIFSEECGALREVIAALANPIYEGEASESPAYSLDGRDGSERGTLTDEVV